MMKKILFNTALAVAVALMAAGCKAFRTVGSEHTATGNPYEVIVVCAQPQWQSELGDTLQAVLRQPVAELPKFEPMFNVMRILPNNFKSLVERHRNIVSVVVRDDIKEPSISVRYDVTAKPQVFVTIKGPDNRSTADYVARNQDNLLYVLEKAERDRSVAYARRYYSPQLEELIRTTFGVEMYIPDNFKLRTKSDDMIWISQEFPTASQGFFIYKYPYSGPDALKADALVNARNAFAARIPGPVEGSYMVTVDKIADGSGENYIPYAPEYRTMRIGDRPWVEMYGLWDVEHYFMGGPYVSYTTVNKELGEVITVDCYVYSPKVDKRNMLRELQHMIYLIDFPETDTLQNEATERR